MWPRIGGSGQRLYCIKGSASPVTLGFELCIFLHNESAMPTQMSSREVIRRLRKEGWVEARQRGSHVQFKHPDKRGARVTVIHPKTSLSTQDAARHIRPGGLGLERALNRRGAI